MTIQTLQQFRQLERYNIVMQRSRSRHPEVMAIVQEILLAVKQSGDTALFEYTQRFDKVELTELQVTRAEIDQAYTQVDASVLAALEQAAAHITIVHRAELPESPTTPSQSITGIQVWRSWQPIERVGLYIPGGQAVYPSSVLMTAIPAKLAGCQQVVMVTPPRPDGTISPVVLVAADKAGVDVVYKVGGAQAIAALAFGTVTIPKVHKIFGPGNAYVAAAKLAAYSAGDVAIDSPAGPSEVVVIADDTANPKFVAADLACDAEHGDDSAGVLVTTSRTLAETVIKEIDEILEWLPTASRVRASLEKYGAIIVVESLEQAIDFANEYAAEHVLVQTVAAEIVAKKITCAGSVFIGSYACKSAGDYATGANHVLPTGGTAKMFSALSVYEFLRVVEYQTISKAGLENIHSTIETLAAVEQLPAHGYSAAVRFNSSL